MAEKKTLMEEIQQVIKELGEQNKKLAREHEKTESAQQKTEAALQELTEEGKKTEAALQELTQEGKKTEAALQDLTQEGKKTKAALQDLKENIRDFKEHVEEQGKKLSLSVDHINWRWGHFMENLAEKDLLKLLCGRGIRVDKILPHLMALDDDGYTRKAEYDLVAHNGEEIVVVEVKTTLFKRDIKDFVAKLGRFRGYFPRWKEYKIYGAMIYMGEAREETDKAVPYAESAGLLLVRCPKGSSGMAKIINPAEFVPRPF